MAKLPYTTSAKGITRALERIKTAATPVRVSQDFVKTVLKIEGSTGNQITTFLKRIGFADATGYPTKLYTEYRGQNAPAALAKAAKHAYSEIFQHNEFAHNCSDKELSGIIVQVTGGAKDANNINRILNSFRALTKDADFSFDKSEIKGREEHLKATPPVSLEKDVHEHRARTSQEAEYKQSLGLNMAYQINIVLPETKDIEIFNAIFKSLRENLLRPEDA